MGYFLLLAKKTTVYQQLRFHFDILRFYQDFTFQSLLLVLHHGGCLPMV
jgi:hypothetical protein